MFQLFLRARAQTYFKARSANRDSETDQARLASVANAVNDALQSTEAERSGLSHRIDDVLARASITIGNGSDEFLHSPRTTSLSRAKLGADYNKCPRKAKYA